MLKNFRCHRFLLTLLPGYTNLAQRCAGLTLGCVWGGVGGVVAKNKMADLRRPRIWISS